LAWFATWFFFSYIVSTDAKGAGYLLAAHQLTSFSAFFALPPSFLALPLLGGMSADVVWWLKVEKQKARHGETTKWRL